MNTTIAKTKWTIDKIHSVVQFKVKHLTISTITGTFKEFQGEVSANDDTFSSAEVRFVIGADSIDTNHGDRDRDLKSETFLSAEKFPHITFEGNLHLIENNYRLQGNLTLREVTKMVELKVDFGGD